MLVQRSSVVYHRWRRPRAGSVHAKGYGVDVEPQVGHGVDQNEVAGFDIDAVVEGVQSGLRQVDPIGGKGRVLEVGEAHLTIGDLSYRHTSYGTATVKPSATNARVSFRVRANPSGLALRVPTTATEGVHASSQRPAK